MNDIVVALITGGLALIGVVLSNKSTEAKIQNRIITNQAITDAKLEELTREVREHNNFARRMPVVENEINHINTEIHELQEYHK